MSSFGKNIKIGIFGESHGPAIGVLIEGLPPGVEINMEYIMKMMNRRKPGMGKNVTKRKESDVPEILSGVYNGHTTGMPLCAIIRNTDTRSRDYSNLKYIPRPGHADYTAYIKYKGYNDIRGGGAFSGRLTAPLVFAGALAKNILEKKGINIVSHIKRIGNIKDSALNNLIYDKKQQAAILDNKFPMVEKTSAKAAEKLIEEVRIDGDSIGCTIETAVYGIETGTGSCGFESLESVISGICFGVPGVKGIEFGKGFEFNEMRGSESNDAFFIKDGTIKTKTNNMGGILGGISNGMPLVFSVCMKPTPSIAKKQNSVDLEKNESAILEIKGRHDPCIGVRAVPVIEACAALALLDFAMGV